MFGRAFLAAVLVVATGLAAVEMSQLWPLVGDSPEAFELEQLGKVDLNTEGREVRLDGLAVSPAGTVWAADTGAPEPRILVLDSIGQQLEQFPGSTAAGISADGEALLTVDPNTSTVSRIERGAGVTRTWDLTPFQLYVPTGAVRVREDAIAVSVTGSGVVFLFHEDGRQIGVLGTGSDGRSLLLEPQYPAVDAEQRLYVADRNGRIVRWNQDAQDATFRTRDREAAVLSDPRQSAIDAQGRLWVADERAGRVWVFDTETGDLIGSWRPEVAPHPTGLAIGGGRIYVTDFGGTFIHWFRLPQ